MTSKISNSALRARVLSWSCALIALIFAFGLARLAFHRLPLFALLVVTGFKYASMFYVAGRLIELTWCHVSKVAARGLLTTGDSESSLPAELDPDLRVKNRRLKTQGQARQPHKNSLRRQMRQLRQAHAVSERDREVSHG
jgi:hypothetical protein